MFRDLDAKLSKMVNVTDNLSSNSSLTRMGAGRKVNVDGNRLVGELQKVLQRLPEVRNAKGTLKVQFSDGKTATVNLNYKER